MKTRKRDYMKLVETTPTQKNPVYKQAVEEPKSTKNVVKSVEDEYEFQVESPGGPAKKMKKRQRKAKVQTLWGLTLKSEAKKVKPSKNVIREAPENLRPTRGRKQVVKFKEVPEAAKEIRIPLQGRPVNSLRTSPDSNKSNSTILVFENKKKNDEKHFKVPQMKKADNGKENNPVVFKETSAAKQLKTPLKQIHCNSTPNEISAMNNIRLPFSPIPVHENVPMSTPKQNTAQKSVQASTPVSGNVCELSNNMSSDTSTPDQAKENYSNSLSSSDNIPVAALLLKETTALSFKKKEVSNRSQSVASDIQRSDNLASGHDCEDDYSMNDFLDKSNILIDISKGAKPSILTRRPGASLNRFTNAPPPCSSKINASQSSSQRSCDNVPATTLTPIQSCSAEIQLCDNSASDQESDAIDQHLLDTSKIFDDVSKSKYSVPERMQRALSNRLTTAPSCPIRPNITNRRPPCLPSIPQESPAKKPHGSKSAVNNLPQEDTGYVRHIVPPVEVPLDMTIENCFGFDDESSEVSTTFDAYIPFPVNRTRPQVPPPTAKLPLIQEVHKMLISSIIETTKQKSKKEYKTTSFHLAEGSTKQKSKKLNAKEDNISLSPFMEENARYDASEIANNTSIFEEEERREDDTDQSFASISSSSSEEGLTSTMNVSTVPLFASFMEEEEDQSPFHEPPRRSYSGAKPAKRIAFLYDPDEEEQEESDEETAAKKRKKKYAGKRGKKMAQTTLIDQWAKNLSSHFAEVDNVELAVE